MWIGVCGGVAPLGNWAHHSLRGRATATLAWRGHQTPWDALMCQNSRDTTLVAIERFGREALAKAAKTER